MGQQETKPSTIIKNPPSNTQPPPPLSPQSSNSLLSIGNSLHVQNKQHHSEDARKKTIMSTLIGDEELLPMGVYSGNRKEYGREVSDQDDVEGKDGWLGSFPHEIIMYILQYLNVESIGRLQRVSKRFLMYWTRFGILWKDLRRVSPMLYMIKDRDAFENVKNILLKRFVVEEDIELPVCAQFAFVGSSRCGKSTLIGRVFSELPFTEKYEPSITFPVVDKHYVYANRKEFSFKIWDTCGNEKYRSIFKSVYSRANVFVYCFDLNCHKSFEEMMEMYQETTVKDISDYSISDRFFILLGLKSELEHQVSREEIEQFLKVVEPEPQQKTIHTSKVQYFELSSKEDATDDLLFPFLYATALLKTFLL